MAAYRRGTTGMRRRDATGVQGRDRTTGLRARGGGTRVRPRGAPGGRGPGVVIGIIVVIVVFVGFIAFVAAQSARKRNPKPPPENPPIAAPTTGTPAQGAPAETQPEEKPVPKPRPGRAIAKAEIKFSKKPPRVWGVCGACTGRVDAGARVCPACGAELEWDAEVECGACDGTGVCQVCKDHPRGLFGMTQADCEACKNTRKCPICRGKKRFQPLDLRPRVRKPKPEDRPSGRGEPDAVPVAPYLRERPEAPETEGTPAPEGARPVLERPPDEPAAGDE